MTTITFSESLPISQTHFNSVEEFTQALEVAREQAPLSPEMQNLLDERLKEFEKDPAGAKDAFEVIEAEKQKRGWV